MTRSLLALAFVLSPWQVLAQASAVEPAAVLEFGAAPARSLSDHTSSIGPTIAVEVSPLEKWLELEAGVTPSFAKHTTEWGTDLLFKKPWTFSPAVEFMAGVGPEWIHTNASGASANAVAGEAVLDFMFWPRRQHKLGWYLEPDYEYRFGRQHEHSIGISFGLLIGIGKR